MPLTGEAKKEHNAKYQRENAERLKLMKRDARLRKRQEYLKKFERENRRRGHAKRTEVDNPARREHVPKIRRYVFIEDRVYFNTELGLTYDELKRVLRDFVEAPGSKAVEGVMPMSEAEAIVAEHNAAPAEGDAVHKLVAKASHSFGLALQPFFAPRAGHPTAADISGAEDAAQRAMQFLQAALDLIAPKDAAK